MKLLFDLWYPCISLNHFLYRHYQLKHLLYYNLRVCYFFAPFFFLQGTFFYIQFKSDVLSGVIIQRQPGSRKDKPRYLLQMKFEGCQNHNLKCIFNFTIWTNILQEINRINVQKEDIITSRSVVLIRSIVKILQKMYEYIIEHWIKEALPVSANSEIKPLLTKNFQKEKTARQNIHR